MSTHFSANQYEQAFAAQRLQNWEVPKRFKERPSTLEGFTRIISNDSGHILEGIPRSSKSPWGEFVGTWDMQKPPLRTRTLKTKAMVEKLQDARTPSPTKMRTPSPQKPKSASPVIEQARTPSPTKMRTPTPQKERTPSPTKVRTPTPQCTSPTKMRTPTPTGRKSTSPVQQKATPVLEAES